MILYLMYFIIHELLGIPEMRSQVLLRMHILNYCTKQIMHKNIFTVFYCIILWECFQQSLWAALHFCSCRYGLCPLFKQRDTDFLWAWQACFGVFQLKNTIKAHYESTTCESPRPLFGLEKKPTFEPKLTSAEAYCRVFWAFISCIQVVFTI